MKNILKLAGIAAIALSLAQTSQAILLPVTGAIGFTGGAVLNSSSAGTATGVTSWVAPQVNLDSGSFSSIPFNTAANFTGATPWSFLTVSTLNNFWTVGGFSFALLSSSITAQGPGFVVVNGTGTVTAAGYTPTTLSWSFTTQDPKITSGPDTWTFSASANSAVPDGGATVMLLGVALSGVALLRKKLTA